MSSKGREKEKAIYKHQQKGWKVWLEKNGGVIVKSEIPEFYYKDRETWECFVDEFLYGFNPGTYPAFCVSDLSPEYAWNLLDHFDWDIEEWGGEIYHCCLYTMLRSHFRDIHRERWLTIRNRIAPTLAAAGFDPTRLIDKSSWIELVKYAQITDDGDVDYYFANKKAKAQLRALRDLLEAEFDECRLSISDLHRKVKKELRTRCDDP